MALKIQYKKRSHGVYWKTGHIYSFKYSAYENDQQPLCIFINSVFGEHPNTGHQHRYIQCINLNYIPRKDRKKFIQTWKDQMQKNKNVKFTWEKVKSRYPYLTESIRRYMTKPNYYIRNAKEIPIEDWEKEVIKSWGKDFSATIKRKLASKMKRFFTGKRR